MRRSRWGRIITITGALALKRMNAATPAKAAIASWSRALVIQVAAEGITVHCVAPGRINSEQVLNRLFPTEEIRRREIETERASRTFRRAGGDRRGNYLPRVDAGELRHWDDDPGRWLLLADRLEIA
jgi:NAD(P)-dependent dehydrogenase (short-subunit alcohol dehydrogenase family)